MGPTEFLMDTSTRRPCRGVCSFPRPTQAIMHSHLGILEIGKRGNFLTYNTGLVAHHDHPCILCGGQPNEAGDEQ